MFIFLLNYFVFVEGDDGDDDKYHNDAAAKEIKAVAQSGSPLLLTSGIVVFV